MNVEENSLSTNVVLAHTGQMILFSAVITEITCGLDMAGFPFDQVIGPRIRHLFEQIYPFEF